MKQPITRWSFKGILYILFHIFYRFDIKGMENIPKEGKAIICPNHIHLFDSVSIVISLKRMIYIMVKKELMSNKLSNWFWDKIGCFPVDRGSADMQALETANAHLQNEDLLLIFPEGTRNGLLKGKKMKKGASIIAMQNKSPIIPVGIKASFIPFTKIKIRIGKPLNLDEFYNKEELTPRDHIQITNMLQEEIIKLRDGE